MVYCLFPTKLLVLSPSKVAAAAAFSSSSKSSSCCPTTSSLFSPSGCCPRPLVPTLSLCLSCLGPAAATHVDTLSKLSFKVAARAPF
ncbi:hypothetical protein ACOSQ2_021140 [Xanthoceras sorbifolium]